MSIPKLKFFALFFVFFAVFWQITTSFYIKMLSAGRQDFSRAAKGAAGLPRKESLRLFSRRQRAMPFAVRFVRRRRTQQKNTKACGRAVCKLAPQNSAPFVLCPATVRPRKENRGTFGGATVCPAPACLGKMAATLAARFLRGRCLEWTLFAITANVCAPFAPTALRNLNNAPAGEASTFEQLRTKVRACNNAPAFAVLFADDLRIQTIRLLRRLRVLSVRRGNVIMIRARVFIYIFCIILRIVCPFKQTAGSKKLQRAQKKRPTKRRAHIRFIASAPASRSRGTRRYPPYR